ncbi:MAG: cation diffusion facilitator family transporter [Thermodesulfobacteriota bacterium]
MTNDKFKNTQLILLAGLIINLLLAAVKFAAGYFAGSRALMADSVHSLSDSLTDVIIMAGACFWSKPPDSNHPYGHRRVETISTLFLGFMLLGASVFIGYEALTNLDNKKVAIPGPVALYTVIFSIIIKEVLYHVTKKTGEKLNSPAVIANAWHHRLDALSSVPVLVAVGGALLYPDLYFLDLAGALIVSVFIFQASVRIIWPGFEEILEKGAPDEICTQIIRSAEKHSCILRAENLRTRYNGTKIFADLNIIVDKDLSVKKGHDIAEEVKKNITEKIPEIEDIIIHVEPDE